MADIAWSNTTPGDDMTASSVDDQLRSDWTAIETALEEFMYWTDGSAASAGEWKLGTAKVRSAGSETGLPAGGGPQGALVSLPYFGEADTANVGGENYGVWHAGSSQTMLVGHAQVAEHVTEPSNAPYTARWVMAEGKDAVSIDRSGTPTVRSVHTFGVVYNGIPNVVATTMVGGELIASEDLLFGVDTISSETFSSVVSLAAASGTAVSVLSVVWSSLGTVNW